MNVTAQFNLGLDYLNIKYLVYLKNLGLGQNLKKFVAGLVRIRVYPPHWWSEGHPVPQDVAVLLFHTGKVMLPGASNEYMARTAAWHLVYMLRAQGIPARMTNFRIETIVASFKLGFQLDVFKFASKLGILVRRDTRFSADIYDGKDGDISYTVLSKKNRYTHNID